jgi:hypothetical protein
MTGGNRGGARLVASAARRASSPIARPIVSSGASPIASPGASPGARRIAPRARHRRGAVTAALAGVLVALGAAGGAAHAQTSNRLWIGRVELVGPLDAVELDCGEAGSTHVAASLVAGERREVRVPLPWSLPLGLEELARVAAPDVRVEPDRGAAGGAARWLGVAPEQPEERWQRLPLGLRVRTRPPAPTPRAAAPPAALLAALAAAALALVLRRAGRGGRQDPGERDLGADLPGGGLAPRVGAGAALVVGALAAGWLTVRSAAAGAGGAATVLWDADRPEAAGPARAVRASAAGGRWSLDPARPGLRVEASPEGAAVRYRVDLAAKTWDVEVAGALVAIAEAPVPAPGAPALAPAWWRDATGAWSRFTAVGGPEDASAAHPAGAGERGEGPAEPPGWLRAGLPPGRAVLLGLESAGPDGREGPATWVRVVGAPRPAREEERD